MQENFLVHGIGAAFCAVIARRYLGLITWSKKLVLPLGKRVLLGFASWRGFWGLLTSQISCDRVNATKNNVNSNSSNSARIEDGPLVTGRGQFMDDLPVSARTAHMAVFRSSIAHGRILRLDVEEARRLPGVLAVITSEEVMQHTAPLAVGIRVPVECWPVAVDRVRYVGEPVAVVVADTRYVAEDAIDLIDVEYETLEPVISIERALEADSSVLHESLGSNLCNDRSFSYGDPDGAFAEADHTIRVDALYPRNSCTPIETYGIVADYDPHTKTYQALTNFQGPFSIHTVVARALKVPGTQLRLKTPPDSGGSFGVKQAQFPYVVLACVAARVAGAPVKWIEDRVEHLTASVSATSRLTTLKAAVTAQGRVLALDWSQVEDVGAFIRAPEPATLYRMMGNMCGAYDIKNLKIRNRIVMTNRTPTGLNRGFGGPQVYFALERLMQRVAVELNLDPVDVIRSNLIRADQFPYQTPSGGLYDSGDYELSVNEALRDGGFDELVKRRDAARADGKLYGIGVTACVEPSVSNMGYITAVLTPEEREKAGPKNGAISTATVSVDPSGSVAVHVASVPQGQGHRTVLASVVGSELGLDASRVTVVTELDTSRDGWSIASGNYSSRFAAAVCGAASIAATRLKDRLVEVAASQLDVPIDRVKIIGGKFCVDDNEESGISFNRVASTGHWAPGTLTGDSPPPLRETVFWTPPELSAPDAEDHVNSSLCHGFIFDFCGVEVDADTGQLKIDRYVTMHDCGRVLHQGMVDGQITGGFAHAIGASIYEELAYAQDGSFVAGTFADYPVPTSMEVPEPIILHTCTPSPFTPLGAKGVGEGNTMSTPVCLANAVADALDASDVQLPLSPTNILGLMNIQEPPAPTTKISKTGFESKPISGAGSITVRATPLKVWLMLLDPETLKRIVPGCHSVERVTGTDFVADVSFGVGPVKGDYQVKIGLFDLDEPHGASLTGEAVGALGNGSGEGRVRLTAVDETHTEIAWEYGAQAGGRVASVGSRLLNGATRIVMNGFFEALGKQAQVASSPGSSEPQSGVIGRALDRLLKRGDS